MTAPGATQMQPQPCITCHQPVVDSEVGWIHLPGTAGESTGWQCPPPHMRLATPNPLAVDVAQGQQPSPPAPPPTPSTDESQPPPAPARRPQPRKIAEIPQYRRATARGAQSIPPTGGEGQ